jgi:alpha-tubulin suppressor-like RCC1 family protein
MVSAGAHHTFFVTEDNLLFSCGCNDDGEIGQPEMSTLQQRSAPMLVKAPNFRAKIINVKCGYQHSVVLCDDGVWMCGMSRKGQLGLKTNGASIFTLTKITYLPPIKDISCGFYFTIVQSIDGKLYGAGEDERANWVKFSDNTNETEKNNEQVYFKELAYKNTRYFCCSGYSLLVIDHNGTVFLKKHMEKKISHDLIAYSTYELKFTSSEDEYAFWRIESKDIIEHHFLRRFITIDLFFDIDIK